MRARALNIALVLAGCGAACITTNPSDDSSHESNVTETLPIFGDDRVGRMLKDHPEKTPTDLATFEETFSVGRRCKSSTSKEMFVIEEAQTREGGKVTEVSGLLPRAVVSGCGNGDTRQSYSLFTAVFSPGGRRGDPDPILTSPLEVMALDDTTGLYNFYVFDNGQSVVRVMRLPDGKIQKIQKIGSGAPKRNDSAVTNPCFSCHVNGGPIMNELHDPWMNWVSFHSEGFSKDDLTKLTGTTRDIIGEALPSNGHGSLAGSLEQTILAANQEFVAGAKEGAGWGPQLLAGKVPGGVPALLKSLFCQTQLDYASTIISSTMPKEAFIDPIATLVAHPETSSAGALPMFQFPIRSEFDRRAEAFAKDAGFVTPLTVAAIRLVDDENDIFSDARCKLLPDVVEKIGDKLPKNPGDVDAAIRAVLTAKISSFANISSTPARKAFIQTLLDPEKSGDLATTRSAYVEEFNGRFKEILAASHEDAGKKALEARDVARKKGARAMFDRSANPLPILDKEMLP